MFYPILLGTCITLYTILLRPDLPYWHLVLAGITLTAAFYAFSNFPS